MKIETSLEINFYQQDEASVYVTSNSSGSKEKFGIMFLFSLYTIRTLVNLGNSGEARALMQFLDKMDTDLKNFSESEKEVKLVKATESKGPKYFIGKMLFDGENLMSYIHKAKGFGMMGKGLGYYAPASVMIFIKWLVNKYKNDKEMFEIIGNMCVGIASIFNNTNVNLTNQTSVAFMAINSVCPQLFEKASKK